MRGYRQYLESMYNKKYSEDQPEMHNSLSDVFNVAMFREALFVEGYYTSVQYPVLFRKNKDTNQTNSNNITIFYSIDTPLYEGALVRFREKIYLILNQETPENTVYRRSDLLQCNMILSAYSDGKDITIPCYSYDLLSTFNQTNGIIKSATGTIEIITGDNCISQNIKINSRFSAHGSSYKIVNLYYQSGICHLFVERIANETPNVYDLTINVEANNKPNQTYTPKAIATINGNTIDNATIRWSSNNTNVISFNGNTYTCNNTGTAFVTANWIEHEVTASAEVTVSHIGTEYITIEGKDTAIIGTSSYKAVYRDNCNVIQDVPVIWSLESDYAGKVSISDGNLVIGNDRKLVGKHITISARYDGVVASCQVKIVLPF